MKHDFGSYELDDDRQRVDVNVAWEFLSTSAYWARWRAIDDFRRQLDASWRVVGVYQKGDGRLVGLARAVSDGVDIAYLADVFVIPEARGIGLGKELVATIIDRGPGAGFRWMLHTADAHGLYAQFGFKKPDEAFMERRASGQ